MMDTLGLTLSSAAPALLELFVRGACLLAVAGLAAQLLRGASASLRHLVWASALWALLVLPIASLFVPSIALPILPSRVVIAQPEITLAVAVPAPNVTPSLHVPDEATPGAPSHATIGRESQADAPAAPSSAVESPAGIDPVTARAWTWRGIAVGVWALVALVLLVEMGRSRLRLRRLAGGAWRIHDPAWWRAAARIGAALGLRRPVLLLATRRTRVPLTWGTRSPIVLLPADADRWPADRREAVLVHELAHVARGDARGHDIARIAAALFWANPLVWVALRMMRAERERACDDLVLATGTRASSYAGDLLEIALTVGGRSHGAAAALAMARPSELEGRLLAILDPAVPRRPATRTARLTAGVVAVMMLIPLAALRPAERMTDASLAEVHEQESAAEPVMSQPAASRDRTSTPLATLDSVPDTVRSSAEHSEVSFLGSEAVRQAESDRLDAGRDPLTRADAVTPALVVSDMAAQTPRAADITSQTRDPDLETLIAVASAAAKLGSDNDKAELLLAVLGQGVRNDSLQAVVLRSASTIGSSFHRHRVMIAMLRDPLAPGTETQFLRAVGGISGAHERAGVLTAFAKENSLPDAAIRQGFLQAVVGVSSEHARAQLLALVIRKPEFDAAAAIDVLGAIRTVSSSHEKANLLAAIAARGVTENAAVREAFIVAATSLNSASDFKRVMKAAGLGEPGPPQ